MDTEYLYTVAEVAVTLAGFSGLVTVLSHRRGGVSAQRNAHSLQSMLLVSFIVTAFALFPRLPASFGMGQQSGWQLSFAALFLAWLLYIIPSRRRYVAVSATLTRLQRRVGNLNFGVHGLTGVGLLLGAFGVWGSRSEAVYLSCLFVLLYMAGYLFVLLFLRLLAETVD